MLQYFYTHISSGVNEQGKTLKQGNLFWPERGRECTSIKKSRIVLALFFKTDDARRAFCVEHDLLPPENLRGTRRINEWIDLQIEAFNARQPLLPIYCGPAQPPSQKTILARTM